MDIATRAAIAREYRDCLRDTLARVSGEDTHRPFHSALLSAEAVQWSRFERSFSTSFGQRVIERVAQLVARASGAEVVGQKHTTVTLKQTQWDEISKLITHARDGRERKRSGYAPNWERDLQQVIEAGKYGSGAVTSREIISDLHWVRDGVSSFASIKTVKPNIDQTAKAKEDLLALAAANSTREVYFALPYNPFGESHEDYSWSPPKGLFNFSTDRSVLIGESFWNTVGGEGTYAEMIEIAIEVGAEMRPAFANFIEKSVEIEYEVLEEVVEERR